MQEAFKARQLRPKAERNSTNNSMAAVSRHVESRLCGQPINRKTVNREIKWMSWQI